MLSFIANYKHKKEIRESKDEILIGQMVLAMSRMGWPAIRFHASGDRQAITFKPNAEGDIVYTTTIILDRKTGGSAISEALVGSKAVLVFQVEIKNYLSDPDDLVNMFKTDLQNIFKMPILGDVRLDHQLNSVIATRQRFIEINSLLDLDGGQMETHKLEALLSEGIGELREKLRQYKRA